MAHSNDQYLPMFIFFSMDEIPLRYDTEEDFRVGRPLHVVWETTLACNLHCQHCGSRAGKARPDELSTEECIDLIYQLARMGTREITIIGGEAFMRRDWLTLIKEITDQGMACAMQSGGYFLSEKKLADAQQSGLKGFGISIDGLKELHDELRGVKGSFEHGLRAIQAGHKLGLPVGVNTQIGPRTIPELRDLFEILITNGVSNWQVQLTVAMGNASDKPELLLQPYQVSEVMDILADLYHEGVERGLVIQAGNNIGYFGPYELYWVRGTTLQHYSGCGAGHTALGIEADGTIKGCPSLPSDDYNGGNVRKRTIADIWENASELRVTRDRVINDLWGFCRTCYYADVCRAGCTWTSHVLFGRSGNNPYCHHRAIELENKGLRERIRKTADAEGKPFDYGRFEIILETLEGEEVERITPELWDQTHAELLISNGNSRFRHSNGENRVPPQLEICRSCDRHVHRGTVNCPFCEVNIAEVALQYDALIEEANTLAAELDEFVSNLEK